MVIYNSALQRKVAAYNYEMVRTYEVYITWIHHPSNIFVRPATITQQDLATLEVAGDQITQEDIIEGKIVVYHSDTLKRPIRGKVYRVIRGDGVDRCAIYSIDYGFYDISVPFLNIFYQGGDPKIRPLATSCRIANCFPVQNTAIWPIAMTPILKIIMGEPTVNIYVRIKWHNYLFVDMFTKNQVDVGKWLVEHRLASSTIWFRRQDNNI